MPVVTGWVETGGGENADAAAAVRETDVAVVVAVAEAEVVTDEVVADVEEEEEPVSETALPSSMIDSRFLLLDEYAPVILSSSSAYMTA